MVRVGAFFQRLQLNNPWMRPDGTTGGRNCCGASMTKSPP